MPGRRLITAFVAAALALAALGCGSANTSSGGGSGSVPAGASVAPASAAVFVSVASDPDSPQWKAAAALLDKFPGKAELVKSLRSSLSDDNIDFDKEIKAALGPELDLVYLDFANGGDNLVGLTQPADKAKFEEALKKGDAPIATRDFQGWLIFAEKEEQLDSFEAAVKNGTLADQEAFSDLITYAPDDALAKFYLSGAPVLRELNKDTTAGGLSLDQLKGSFDLRGLVGWTQAEEDGIRFELDIDAKTALSTETFQPKLAEDFPTGALFYASLGHLDSFARSSVDSALKKNPQMKQQLEAGLTLLGLSLEGDIYPVLEGETAVGVYDDASSPESLGVLLATEVSDESSAKRLLSRLQASFLLGGQTLEKQQIGGAEFTELASQGQNVLVGVAGGKLIIANSQKLVEGLLGSGTKLSADPAYTSALSSADAPDETSTFVFANLATMLPFLFDYAEKEGDAVPSEAKDNVEPLHSVLVYGSVDGDVRQSTGFVEIR